MPHMAPPPWRRPASTSSHPPPPAPRPWKPTAPSDRIARHPEGTATTTTTTAAPTPERRSLIRRLWPFASGGGPPKAVPGAEPPDAARGAAATRRVVTDGVLDPRYRPAARRVTALICALPIAAYLGWELFQRRFLGKERKVRPGRKKMEGDTDAAAAPAPPGGGGGAS